MGKPKYINDNSVEKTTIAISPEEYQKSIENVLNSDFDNTKKTYEIKNKNNEIKKLKTEVKKFVCERLYASIPLEKRKVHGGNIASEDIFDLDWDKRIQGRGWKREFKEVIVLWKWLKGHIEIDIEIPKRYVTRQKIFKEIASKIDVSKLK